MTSNRLQLLIEEVGGEIGLPGMRLDEEGVCMISTDEGVEIVLNHLDDDDGGLGDRRIDSPALNDGAEANCAVSDQ